MVRHFWTLLTLKAKSESTTRNRTQNDINENQWKHPESPKPRRIKQTLSAGKVNGERL